MRPAGTTLARSYYLNLKTDFGAVGDGATDDTAALNNAATAFSTLGASIFMPVGNYKTTTGITLSQTTPLFGHKWVGEGSNRSVFKPTGAGVNCITLSGSSSQAFSGGFEDFGIQGDATTGNGIQSFGANPTIFSCIWRNLSIQTGGECVHIELDFHFTMDHCDGTALGSNHVFVLHGGNTTLLSNCEATGNDSALQKAGFRIGSNATLLCCNGCDHGDYWGMFGSQASFTGTAISGSTSTTIKFVLTTSPFGVNSDDVIVGYNIRLTGGTGVGQTRLCTNYNGTTRVATVTPAWSSTPDTTTTYSVEDPVTFLHGNNYPQIAMIGCNIEGFSYNGVRLMNAPESIGFSMDNCVFQVARNCEAPLRLFYSGAASQSHTLKNVWFTGSGTRSLGLSASRTTQDILLDANPPGLLLINSYPRIASGAYNQYYDIGAATSRSCNSITSTSIALPNMPTSNPNDGSKTMWNNAGAITLGT